MSQIPQFTIKELLDAGVHFGHKTMRWNPKMKPYIFGERDNIHIIDLQQTVPLLHRALTEVHNVVKNNGRVLFVGTKRQASQIVADAATRCGQYYVNHRWLGGMLTNWGTISKSIKTLTELESKLKEANTNEFEEGTSKLTKKEILDLDRKIQKLKKSLDGIREMGGKPDLLFVIDTNKESLAIKEAVRLGIPVIAILDSNSNPDDISLPIPGNDDATRSITLYTRLISEAALSGIHHSLKESGVDLGAAKEIGVNNKFVSLTENDFENATEVDESKKAVQKPAVKLAKKVANVKSDDATKK